MSSKKFKTNTKKVKAERVKKEPSVRGRTLLASLFNNQAAYDGGRREKGWLALILFTISIVISLIPAMVHVGRTKGSDIYKGNLYHTDVALTKFVETLDTNAVNLKIVQEGEQKVFSDGDGSFATTVGTARYTLSDGVVTEDVPYYTYIQKRTMLVRNSEDVLVSTEVDFEYLRVYYTAPLTKSYVSNGAIMDGSRFLATKLLALSGDEMTNNVTSHLIIGSTSIYTRIYNPTKINDPKTPALSFEGRTSTLPLDLNIRDFAAISLIDGTTFTSTDVDYTEKVVANFAYMQDLAYKEVKTRTFWFQTGIYAVIFTLIGLVMGLIIFISTRGKMNPNRDLKFFEAMKVGAWLLPTPALLTLVLGFILPASYFQMIFIMALGMRSVWLTMRTLGPQAPQKR